VVWAGRDVFKIDIHSGQDGMKLVCKRLARPLPPNFKDKARDMGRRIFGIVAILWEDLLGGLEERVGGKSVSFGKSWVERFSQSNDFIEENDICRRQLADHGSPIPLGGRALPSSEYSASWLWLPTCDGEERGGPTLPSRRGSED